MCSAGPERRCCCKAGRAQGDTSTLFELTLALDRMESQVPEPPERMVFILILSLVLSNIYVIMFLVIFLRKHRKLIAVDCKNDFKFALFSVN